jgi:hypothetical protein
MAVMAREVWTDERLDDLSKRVDEGFKETREEFRAVRSEIKSEFQSVRGEIQTVRGDLGGQIAALHRTTFQLFVGMMVTMGLGFGGLIVTRFLQT